jgi:hypothetical protein
MDVDSFFSSYVRAFDSFNHRAIAGHYHYPSLLASAEGASAFYDRADAEKKFKQVCDNHKRIGYHHANLAEKEVEVITENLCRATVLWRFENESNRALVEFVCTYTLADYGRGLEIIAALVHG